MRLGRRYRAPLLATTCYLNTLGVCNNPSLPPSFHPCDSSIHPSIHPFMYQSVSSCISDYTYSNKMCLTCLHYSTVQAYPSYSFAGPKTLYIHSVSIIFMHSLHTHLPLALEHHCQNTIRI